MFCSYMLLGIMFLMVFGYKIAYDEYFSKPTTLPLNVSVAADAVNVTVPTAPTKNSRDFARRYYITFTALVCIGVFFALGALTMWHARLITNGETSIEAHINKKERIRLGKEGIVYVNPYDFGPRRNWRRFLGLTHGRTWRHLLWPSAHPPEGSGLTWDTIYQTG
uniref:Putative palmitoyltransferase zdhhc16-like protein n=2 Tax=Ixodes scapularis TaxID=6945 RepID=A0A4D5RT23_IXOSC